MTLLILFFISIFIELIVGFLVGRIPLRINNNWKTSLLAILGVNLVSYPLAWLAFFGLQDFVLPIIAFILAEVLVILIEALLLKLQLIITIKQSLFISLCMNVASALIGAGIWYSFFVYSL